MSLTEAGARRFKFNCPCLVGAAVKGSRRGLEASPLDAQQEVRATTTCPLQALSLNALLVVGYHVKYHSLTST